MKFDLSDCDGIQTQHRSGDLLLLLDSGLFLPFYLTFAIMEQMLINANNGQPNSIPIRVVISVVNLALP